jgi:exonuclease VII small subunit
MAQEKLSADQEHIRELKRAVAAMEKAQTEFEQAEATLADKRAALTAARNEFKRVASGRAAKETSVVKPKTRDQKAA